MDMLTNRQTNRYFYFLFMKTINLRIMVGIGFDRNGFLTIMVVYLNQPFLYTSWWLTNEVSIIENVEMGSTFKPPNPRNIYDYIQSLVKMICTQKRVVMTLFLPCQIMISFVLSSEAYRGYGDLVPPWIIKIYEFHRGFRPQFVPSSLPPTL